MILTDIEEIGEGAFAKVFRVEDDTGNQYAKKLFSPQSAIEKAIGKDDLKRRFIREVKYQDSLQHPNIVEIIEILKEIYVINQILRTKLKNTSLLCL